jgi:hypothetical protein
VVTKKGCLPEKQTAVYKSAALFLKPATSQLLTTDESKLIDYLADLKVISKEIHMYAQGYSKLADFSFIRPNAYNKDNFLPHLQFSNVEDTSSDFMESQFYGDYESEERLHKQVFKFTALDNQREGKRLVMKEEDFNQSVKGYCSSNNHITSHDIFYSHILEEVSSSDEKIILGRANSYPYHQLANMLLRTGTFFYNDFGSLYNIDAKSIPSDGEFQYQTKYRSSLEI